jgi:hypothetical protein
MLFCCSEFDSHLFTYEFIVAELEVMLPCILLQAYFHQMEKCFKRQTSISVGSIFHSLVRFLSLNIFLPLYIKWPLKLCL